MARSILVIVRFHDERYHGAGDRPPSPARLFQALVAGAGLSGPLRPEDSVALEWLEALSPPLIACPVMLTGQSLRNAVPNNDLDAVGGDLRRIAQIRTWKTITPQVFDTGMPLLYAWTFDEDNESNRQAQTICALAERLCQLGRGVDMAWAWGELLDTDELEKRLSTYLGLVYRPSNGGRRKGLACPRPGSLDSLRKRYAANSQRFKVVGQGIGSRQLLSQQPKARFAQVAYEGPSSKRVYDIHKRSGGASLSVWPLAKASKLVVWLRDGAVARLRRALPDQSSEIERLLVGRKADGADEGPTSLRVRVVPLPSVGHPYADHAIRRVLVEVPAGCPLRADDVHWAFSGLEPVDQETGEILDLVLASSDDDSMLGHYGVGDRPASRVWRTVTAAALPESAGRRRMDPRRLATEAKDGAERAVEQTRAAGAVVQALRHAGIEMRAEAVRVQREPFEARGERAEEFAPGTRFAKHRLWHVEVTFNAPIAGPLVIGDGRFLGLGVMAPAQRTQGLHAFVVEGGLAATAQRLEITRALRRATMARVQEVVGARNSVPAFFTGHEGDGSPAQTERRGHLTFVFDPGSARLFIIAPHVIGRRAPTGDDIRHLDTLEAALTGFRELRAGSAGCLTLRAISIDLDEDPLFAPSRTWENVTLYQVTRHTKQVGAGEALSVDLRAECRRRGLPEPDVTPREPHGVSGVGLVGGASLTFAVAIRGPLVLGKSRHLGGGLFTGTAATTA